MMTWSIAWWWLVRTPLHTLSTRPGPRHEALGHSKYSPIQCLMKRYTSAALAMFSTLTSSDGTSATVVPLLSCNQWADIDSSESRVEGIPTSSEFLPGYGLREPAATVFDEDAIWFPSSWRKTDDPVFAARSRATAKRHAHKGVAVCFREKLLPLLNCADFRLMRTAVKDVDLARYLEDSFWMLAILTECVFERLRAAREQTSENTILLADDPVSKTILANKDGRPGGASGRIFDKLHDHKSMSLPRHYRLRIVVITNDRGRSPSPIAALQSRTDRRSPWKSTANTKQVPLPTLGKADPLSLLLETSKRALPPSGTR